MIPFIDLRKQYQNIQTEIDARIKAVLEHGQYILGPEVGALEKKLADWVGVKHCISVANGTDALLVSLMALGVRSGDEVITTPFTFIANAEMIALLGAVPIFVDIDPDTYNIDPAQIEKAITPKTKCILPVSLYGQCANMDAINQIAKDYHLPVIEDAAQSFGATRFGKKSCSLSTIGCTSFFPTKPLGCYGDGGACFTDDDALASAMRQIRVHGQDKKYSHRLLGMNSRLDTLQAAILLAKLDVFDEEVVARQRIGQRYTQLLQGSVKVMRVSEHNTCVYAQFTIEVPERSDFQEGLKAAQIPTAIHYPVALHHQPAFSWHPQRHQAFPVSEKAADHVLSLPMHPWLTESDQDHIVSQVVALLERSREYQT